MKRTLLALSITALVAGCGGSDSKRRTVDTDTPPVNQPPPSTELVEISGAAMAPGGAVAYFQKAGPLQVVLNFLVPQAAAAITGLSPVAGATVELIRVDNEGNQVGDVLDSTTTNDDGEYTLELPENETLGGDLLVSISGVGIAKMRAQVVSEKVDITPVSEFILQKFIESGVDLKALPKESVIELSVQINDLDLEAGTDMSLLLTSLEEQAGEFVADKVEVIVAGSGDSSLVAGAYRNVAFEWGLHDSDGNYGTSFTLETWITELTIDAGEGKELTVHVTSETDWGSNQMSFGAEPTEYQLTWDFEEELLDESFPAAIDGKGVVSISVPAEDQVNGDFGQRWPATLVRFQKAPSSGLLVGAITSRSVRYETKDTDGDDEPDALDLEKRSGDEYARGFDFLLKKPTEASTADVEGNFGRVYMAIATHASGWIEMEAENNTLSFDGNGALYESDADRLTIGRHGNGGTEYHFEVLGGEADIPYAVSADGRFSFEGSETHVYINDTFDFIAASGFEVDDEVEGFEFTSHDVTLAVKLPQSAISIEGKRYRFMTVEVAMFDTSIELSQLRFGSTVEITGPTTADIEVVVSDLMLENRGADIEATPVEKAGLTFDYTLQNSGYAEFTFAEPEGTMTLSGYMNHDGSLGVFTLHYADSIGGSLQDPHSLGLGIMVEIE